MVFLLVVITTALAYLAFKIKNVTDDVGKLLALHTNDRMQRTTSYPLFSRTRLDHLLSESVSSANKYEEYSDSFKQLHDDEEEVSKAKNTKFLPSDALENAARKFIEMVIESEDTRNAYNGAIEANIKVINGSPIEEVSAEYNKHHGFSARMKRVRETEKRYKEWLESYN